MRNLQKYKNISSAFAKKNEEKYLSLKLTTSARDERLLAVSDKFMLIGWHSMNGGLLGILDITTDFGRRCENCPKLNAHGSQITDMSFSPFDNYVFATSCVDGTVKVWSIPSDFPRNNTINPIATLKHGKKSVNVIKWHPTASGILASGGDEGLKIWDLAKQLQEKKNESSNITEKISFEGTIQSLSWNYDGSLLALGTKDGKLQVYDPRKNTKNFDLSPNNSNFPVEVSWLGNRPWVITTGHGKFRESQLKLFNGSKGDKLFETNIDSNSSSTLRSVYDSGSEILVVFARGDVILKIFEVVDERPYIRGLNPVNTGSPFKTVEPYPRRLLDFDNAEVLRLLKVTQNEILPVALKVPKGKTNDWREDLYPDVLSSKPALSAEAWFSGVNAQPLLESLKPKALQIEEEQAEVDVEDDEWYTPKGMKMVRTTQYRHIFGEVVGQSQFYTDLKPANNAVMSHTIRANKTYFSIGLEGTGGRLGVFPLSNTGRLNKPIPCIETGFDVHDFDFHSFHNVMATGGDSGAVQVWTIPEGGLASLKSNLTTPTIQLLAHGGKINTIDFHPSANNVLASTATDNKIILWDIQSEQPQVTIPNTDATINITWNATGTVLAASNKDNKILIYDVRTRTPSSEGEGLGGTKGTRIEWIGGKNQIFAIGFTKESNERRYKLMDTRMMNEALYSERIDYGSGVFYTHYQEGMDVIAIWGKGDSSLKFIEMSDEQPYCRYLTDYTSLTMQIGIAFLPLSVCDVKEVEFARILKLTNENTVQPHRLFVPRTRKEYFQDDIFPPSQIRAEVPSQTAQQYFAGEEAEPLRVNLNPGLPLYSEAPKIVRKMKKYKEVVEEDPTKVEEKTLDSIYNKMIEKRDADLPLAHELNEGVDSDEWSE